MAHKQKSCPPRRAAKRSDAKLPKRRPGQFTSETARQARAQGILRARQGAGDATATGAGTDPDVALMMRRLRGVIKAKKTKPRDLNEAIRIFRDIRAEEGAAQRLGQERAASAPPKAASAAVERGAAVADAWRALEESMRPPAGADDSRDNAEGAEDEPEAASDAPHELDAPDEKPPPAPRPAAPAAPAPMTVGDPGDEKWTGVNGSTWVAVHQRCVPKCIPEAHRRSARPWDPSCDALPAGEGERCAGCGGPFP